jgi:hypothetical protein
MICIFNMHLDGRSIRLDRWKHNFPPPLVCNGNMILDQESTHLDKWKNNLCGLRDILFAS